MLPKISTEPCLCFFVGGFVCHWYALSSCQKTMVSQILAILSIAFLKKIAAQISHRWWTSCVGGGLCYIFFTTGKARTHPSKFTTFPWRVCNLQNLNFCNILACWIRILRSFLFSLWNSTLETFEHRVPSSNLVSLDLNAKNRTCHAALKQQCHFQPDFLTLSTFWANTIYASLCEIFLGAKAGATLLLAAWTKRIQQETWQLVGWAQTWLIDLLFTAAFFLGEFFNSIFRLPTVTVSNIWRINHTGFSMALRQQLAGHVKEQGWEW